MFRSKARLSLLLLLWITLSSAPECSSQVKLVAGWLTRRSSWDFRRIIFEDVGWKTIAQNCSIFTRSRKKRAIKNEQVFCSCWSSWCSCRSYMFGAWSWVASVSRWFAMKICINLNKKLFLHLEWDDESISLKSWWILFLIKKCLRLGMRSPPHEFSPRLSINNAAFIADSPFGIFLFSCTR